MGRNGACSKDYGAWGTEDLFEWEVLNRQKRGCRQRAVTKNWGFDEGRIIGNRKIQVITFVIGGEGEMECKFKGDKEVKKQSGQDVEWIIALNMDVTQTE